MNANWNIDFTHSSVAFTVRHMVVAKVHGQFKSWNGTLTFDPDAPEQSKVVAEIDVASIDTGVADRDAHLRTADFFDVEAFPTIRFESTRVDAVGNGNFNVVGNLTIRDITREVTLDAELAGTAVDPWGNERAIFSAKTAINRTDFGLTYNQVLEAGGLLVSEKVEIALDVQAVAVSDAGAASA